MNENPGLRAIITAGGGLFGSRAPAGGLLGSEASGLAADFTAIYPSLVIRDAAGSTNYSGDPFAGGRVAFSRASSATRINPLGQIETLGNDVPRIDYDPVTRAPLGLLVEEQRTNLLLNSATLSTQSVTVAATPYTLSFYGTGTITLSGASTAGPLVGTGAFPNRVTLTFTPAAGSLTLTVTGTVSNAQLEAGGFATSYIPTTSVSATRAADDTKVLTTAFPYNSATWTVVTAYRPFNVSGATRGVWALTDGTNNNTADWRPNGGNFTVVSGGVSQVDLFPGSVAVNAIGKGALAAAANDVAVCRDGGTVLTDTVATMPTGINQLQIGYLANSTVQAINGWIRQITYIPRRLSNTEIQARTA